LTDKEGLEKIMLENGIHKNGMDMIISDLAPNTIGFKDIDAIRCIQLLRE
jgi:23S rRNA U2552 (ribose-2'-O)-methylase RlmE/FtsJ